MSLRSVRDELKTIRDEISNPRPRRLDRMGDKDRSRLARRVCAVIAAAAAESRGIAHDLDPLTPYQRGMAGMLKEQLCQTEGGRQFVAKLEGMAP